MRLSVDRVEGGFAVCQDLVCEGFLDVSLTVLPKNIKEGDIIYKDNDGFFKLDRAATERRREEIIKLQDKIFGGCG